jgi:hypothetical protein
VVTEMKLKFTKEELSDVKSFRFYAVKPTSIAESLKNKIPGYVLRFVNINNTIYII